MTIEPDQPIESLAEDNYNYAKKCFQSVERSRELGVTSAETLHEQGSQIERIGKHIDTVQATLDRSEKLMSIKPFLAFKERQKSYVRP